MENKKKIKPSINEVCYEIIDYIKKNNSVISNSLNKKSLLISEGIIDSSSIIDVILFLEKKYKISFDENDLLSDDAATPLGISKIILKKIK